MTSPDPSTAKQSPNPDRQERADLLLWMGSLGLLGCFALIAGTFVAPHFVPHYDPVADTISDLAAGEGEIVMDLALYGFATGLIATALAASHAHLGRFGWSVGVVSLAILGALVIVIGARNEYGDGDNEGVVIHIYLVYGLGVFFLLAPLVMASALRKYHPRAGTFIIAMAILWGLAAPVFFFLPTGIDGLYERALGLIACAMVATLSAVFLMRGRQGRSG